MLHRFKNRLSASFALHEHQKAFNILFIFNLFHLPGFLLSHVLSVSRLIQTICNLYKTLSRSLTFPIKAVLCLAFFSDTAFALTPSPDGEGAGFLFSSPYETAFFTFSIIMLGVATLLAFFYTRDWNRWKKRAIRLRSEISRLHILEERIEILMSAQRQVVIQWDHRDSEAKIEGNSEFAGSDITLGQILAFGLWVVPADVPLLQKAINQLRDQGEGFILTIKAKNGGFVSAEGRTTSGKVFVRLCEIDVMRGEILRMNEELTRARADLELVSSFLDSIRHPVWLRDSEGRLIWLNKAYLNAVGAHSLDDVQNRSLEIHEQSNGTEIPSLLAGYSGHASRCIATQIGDTCQVLDITEEQTPTGSAGLAIDISPFENACQSLRHEMEIHARTLNQLHIAVAVFDKNQQLIFHNSAFQRFWQLDSQFLASNPLDDEILEFLRAKGKLPEQADFRQWKQEFLSAYDRQEFREVWWHLPDRKTVHVTSSPNPQGGLTYLFDDVTDRMRLESQMTSFRRVQNETLDALKEGVAAFGSDGRLRYYNHAFAQMWNFVPEALQNQPHIDSIINYCSASAPDKTIWDTIRSAVTGLHDIRLGLTLQIERLDERTIDCQGQPLPDGATLLTFGDITDSVTKERILIEKNDALEKAAKMRNDFVHHFSYQVRSPLTNVIGFAQLLNSNSAGILSHRQKEYVTDIMRSSSALLAILNDILDLASIDMGALALTMENVDIRSVAMEAAKGLEDRFSETSMKLDIAIPDETRFLRADSKRIRQILFNLLSNALSFSHHGQTIRIVSHRTENGISIDVIDQGAGIPDEIKDRIFGRFESIPSDSSPKGLGLGLSMVRSLVELHGGHVEIVSQPDKGTCVSCYFPDNIAPQEIAA